MLGVRAGDCIERTKLSNTISRADRTNATDPREGAFENITFSNSVIYNDEVDLNSRIISGICLEMVDGGSVDGVVITGIRMQRTRTPIFLRLGNRTPRKDGSPGTLRSVIINDTLASDAVLTSSITGIPERSIEDVTLSNICVSTLEETKENWLSKPVPEDKKGYPEARMFGRLPAYGLYSRHVLGLSLRDVRFTSKARQQTPAVACDSVTDLEIVGLRTSVAFSTASTVSFSDVRDAWIHDTRVTGTVPSLLSVEGAHSANILISSCDLREAAQPATHSPTLPDGALRLESNITGRSS